MGLTLANALPTEGVLLFVGDPPEPIPNWQSVGRHHWSMLALLYGSGPPLLIDGNLPTLGVDERLEKVAALLGMSAGVTEIEVNGPGDTGTVVVNTRLIDKMRNEEYAARTPFISWAPHAVSNAIEIWRNDGPPRDGGPSEKRTYYLAPLTPAEENECYMAICGADRVIFNVMRSKATYANSMRWGELLYAKDTPPCERLCCDRYLELRSDLIRARADVLELQRENRKLRDLLKRRSG